MTPDHFVAYLAEKHELPEETAEAIFDEAWTYVLSYASRSFPNLTRDMVSRGQVQRWLFELANGEEDA